MVKFPISFVTLCDVRQLESVLNEISIAPSAIISEDISTNLDNASHIASAESHILQVIDIMYLPDSDDDLVPGADVSRLQFVLCQLRNSIVLKNRRRYNVLTQILSLKTHRISLASYQYLQSIFCICLPHSKPYKNSIHPLGLKMNSLRFLSNIHSPFLWSKGMSLFK